MDIGTFNIWSFKGRDQRVQSSDQNEVRLESHVSDAETHAALALMQRVKQ
jgi:hypothetical protein